MAEENDSGLLHHAHPTQPENPYSPDETAVGEAAGEAVIARTAGESHHGLGRKADTAKLGREEEAKLALENTDISKAAAWVLTVLFVLTIFGPPIFQATVEMRDRTRTTSAPKFLEVLHELPSWGRIKSARNFEDTKKLLPDADRLKAHEQSLEDDSVLVQSVLPGTQEALTRYGGAGNEQAYPGNDGWLFYRPDVDYLTAPGFLDPAMVARRKRSSQEDANLVQPDPVRAITEFRDQLAQRNIQFILMPMPVKPMIEAQHMNSAYNAAPRLQNASYENFISALSRAGVMVYDPTELLRRRKEQEKQPQFLQTDTHWTPGAMKRVAAELASFISERKLAVAGETRYSNHVQSATNLGDTAVMLGLAESQKLYPQQNVTINPIHDSSGAPWRRKKGAQILLLGDSFCNVFSLEGMGWGKGAGFAEQLSYRLQTPMDSIVVNAGGAYTSRQRLVGEMTREHRKGRDRLAGVKLVIWEFSMRDLLIGDWKLLKLP